MGHPYQFVHLQTIAMTLRELVFAKRDVRWMVKMIAFVAKDLEQDNFVHLQTIAMDILQLVFVRNHVLQMV